MLGQNIMIFCKKSSLQGQTAIYLVSLESSFRMQEIGNCFILISRTLFELAKFQIWKKSYTVKPVSSKHPWDIFEQDTLNKQLLVYYRWLYFHQHTKYWGHSGIGEIIFVKNVGSFIWHSVHITVSAVCGKKERKKIDHVCVAPFWV